MPFKSKAQRRACYAAKDPNWDCSEFEKDTPKKLPERKTKKEAAAVLQRILGKHAQETIPALGYDDAAGSHRYQGAPQDFREMLGAAQNAPPAITPAAPPAPAPVPQPPVQQTPAPTQTPAPIPMPKKETPMTAKTAKHITKLKQAADLANRVDEAQVGKTNVAPEVSDFSKKQYGTEKANVMQGKMDAAATRANMMRQAAQRRSALAQKKTGADGLHKAAVLSYILNKKHNAQERAVPSAPANPAVR